MKIGYVRVSKQEQHEALQIDALREVGCEKWFLINNYLGPALRTSSLGSVNCWKFFLKRAARSAA